MVQGGKYYYNRNRWNIEKHGEYGIYKETSGMRISMVQKTKIIPNKRSTLVAFTVGERYQPGGEFKVLKFNNSHCIQITLQGDRGPHRLSGFESETSFCQDGQRLHPGNVRDLRRGRGPAFIRKVF